MNRGIQPNNFPGINFYSHRKDSVPPRPGLIPNTNICQPRLSAGVIPFNNFFLSAVARGALPPSCGHGNPGVATSHGNGITVRQTPIPLQPCLPLSSGSLPPHSVVGANRHYNNSVCTAIAPTPLSAALFCNPALKADRVPSPRPNGPNPSMVSAKTFASYAMSTAKGPVSSLAQQFLPLRRVDSEAAILKAINSEMCAGDALGIYSESPFLRPVVMLRPTRFASPSNIHSQYPDPDNMIRTLRDLADQRVASMPVMALISGSKPNALALGFYTDYMIHVFNVELDLNLIGFLNEQAKSNNAKLDKYRVVLRLGWATQGLYLPGSPRNPNRALAAEVLPRCLSVRVARRNVPLPDPIFHGGQATKLGHRLRFSIDITDKIPIRPANMVRSRNVEIELTWLHASLEDHAASLLDVVGSGSCTPIMNHIINMPLVQVTLDRVQTIPQFVRQFSTAVAGTPSDVDPPVMSATTYGGFQVPKFTPDQLVGCYDFCASSERVLSVATTLEMLKEKLSSHDDLLCDNWIPVTLLCPLTLTRIEVPVRSVNCDHLQCYDLTSYLTINKRRPRWSCPVCSGPAPFRDLRRDDFFLQLLRDKSLGDADRLQVDVQGRWRKAMDTYSDLDDVNRSRQQNALDAGANGGDGNAKRDRMGGPEKGFEDDESNTNAIVTPVKADPQPSCVPGGATASNIVVVIDSDDEEEEEQKVPGFEHIPVEALTPSQPSSSSVVTESASLMRLPSTANTDQHQQCSKLTALAPVALPSAPSFFVDLTGSSDEEKEDEEEEEQQQPPRVPSSAPSVFLHSILPLPPSQLVVAQQQFLRPPLQVVSTTAFASIAQAPLTSTAASAPEKDSLLTDIGRRPRFDPPAGSVSRLVLLPTTISSITTTPTAPILASVISSGSYSSMRRQFADTVVVSSASVSSSGQTPHSMRVTNSVRFKVTAKRRCTTSPLNQDSIPPKTSRSLVHSTESTTNSAVPLTSMAVRTRCSNRSARKKLAQTATPRRRVFVEESEEDSVETSESRVGASSNSSSSAEESDSDGEWTPQQNSALPSRRQIPQTARRGGGFRKRP